MSMKRIERSRPSESEDSGDQVMRQSTILHVSKKTGQSEEQARKMVKKQLSRASMLMQSVHQFNVKDIGRGGTPREMQLQVNIAQQTITLMTIETRLDEDTIENVAAHRIGLTTFFLQTLRELYVLEATDTVKRDEIIDDLGGDSKAIAYKGKLEKKTTVGWSVCSVSVTSGVLEATRDQGASKGVFLRLPKCEIKYPQGDGQKEIVLEETNKAGEKMAHRFRTFNRTDKEFHKWKVIIEGAKEMMIEQPKTIGDLMLQMKGEIQDLQVQYRNASAFSKLVDHINKLDQLRELSLDAPEAAPKPKTLPRINRESEEESDNDGASDTVPPIAAPRKLTRATCTQTEVDESSDIDAPIRRKAMTLESRSSSASKESVNSEEGKPGIALVEKFIQNYKKTSVESKDADNSQSSSTEKEIYLQPRRTGDQLSISSGSIRSRATTDSEYDSEGNILEEDESDSAAEKPNDGESPRMTMQDRKTMVEQALANQKPAVPGAVPMMGVPPPPPMVPPPPGAPGCGPPGPPPPPPSSKVDPRKTKLVKVHWKTAKVSGKDSAAKTVWAGESLLEAKDKDVIKEYFEDKKKPSSVVKALKKQASADKLIQLDADDSRNLEIIMRQQKWDNGQDIVDHVFEIGEEDSDAQKQFIKQLQEIYKIADKNKHQLVKIKASDVKKLPAAERRLYEFYSIPKLGKKLEIVRNLVDTIEQGKCLERNLQLAKEACDKVTNCGTFKKFLKLTLDVGNYLNDGTKKRMDNLHLIETLPKITDTRSPKDSTTLLQVILAIANRKGMDVEKMVDEMNLDQCTTFLPDEKEVENKKATPGFNLFVAPLNSITLSIEMIKLMLADMTSKEEENFRTKSLEMLDQCMSISIPAAELVESLEETFKELMQTLSQDKATDAVPFFLVLRNFITETKRVNKSLKLQL